jgi:hypothetical protein
LQRITVASEGVLSMGTDDEQLMDQLAAGRPEALGPLHARYASLVYGVAGRCLDRKALRQRLSPLVGAGMILAGALTVAGLLERAHQATLKRHGRALARVTNSEVVPWHLSPAPEIKPEPHGNYRGRRGVGLAVLTVSHLPPAPSGYEYRAWASHAGHWTLLGCMQVDSDGRCLLIADDPKLATPPDKLKVTLEPVAAH